VEMSKHVDRETLNKDLKATENVISSGSKYPQPVPDAKTAEQLLERIGANLADDNSDAIALFASDSIDTEGNEDAICSFSIALYEEALKLPRIESSLLLRHMLSGNK